MKKFFTRDLVNAFLLYHQQSVCCNPFGGCSLGKDQIGKEGGDARFKNAHPIKGMCPVRFIPITAKMDGE